MASFFDRNQPPTTDMFDACRVASPGSRSQRGSAVARPGGGGRRGARDDAARRAVDYDFLVLSTGLVTDPALRPELAAGGRRHRALGGSLRAAAGHRKSADRCASLSRPRLRIVAQASRKMRTSRARPVRVQLFCADQPRPVCRGAFGPANMRCRASRRASPISCSAMIEAADPRRLSIAYDEAEFIAEWRPPRGRPRHDRPHHPCPRYRARPPGGWGRGAVVRGRHLLFAGETNEDGRCPALLEDVQIAAGRYRLEFAVADYFRAIGVALDRSALSRCRDGSISASPMRAAIIMCRCSSRPLAIRPIVAVRMTLHAFRGELLSVPRDPLRDANAVRHEADGLLVVEDGIVVARGDHADLAPRFPPLPVERCPA